MSSNYMTAAQCNDYCCKKLRRLQIVCNSIGHITLRDGKGRRLVADRCNEMLTMVIKGYSMPPRRDDRLQKDAAISLTLLFPSLRHCCRHDIRLNIIRKIRQPAYASICIVRNCPNAIDQNSHYLYSARRLTGRRRGPTRRRPLREVVPEREPICTKFKP